MTRRNISLPDDLDQAARDQGLNVSALAQQAIVDALDRESRMARLDAWLDELDAEHGPPSVEAVAEAEAWVASAKTAGAEEPASIRPSRSGPAARRSRTGGVKQKAKTFKKSTASAQTVSKSASAKKIGRTRKAAR